MQIMQSFELIGFDALKLNSDEKSILKESYRRIDLSAIAKGYAVDEIADYLDISVTAAKVRLHRAHQKLRQILEDVER